MNKLIPYSKQKIDNEDINSVLKVLKSNYLTKGPITEKFETSVSKFIKVNYSVAVINASSALILACKAIGIKKKDLVWTTVNTYISTINSALHCEADIDLVDISLDDYNLDIKSLEQKLKIAKMKKKLPKVLIVVHLAGYPNDMKKIYSLSKKYKFLIIEDASHAFGSKFENSYIGNCKYSELTIFSFHPVKVITSAEGGISTTNKNKYYKKILKLRENGIIKKVSKKKIDPNFYDIENLGYNFRLNEINASLGISQLKKTKSFIKEKNKIAKYYYQKLNNNKILLPKYLNHRVTSWHLFIIRFNLKMMKKNKGDIVRFFKKNNIFVNTHYIPLNYFSYLKKILPKNNYKKAKEYYESSISIPIYPGLKKKHQDHVINTINRILN